MEAIELYDTLEAAAKQFRAANGIPEPKAKRAPPPKRQLG